MSSDSIGPRPRRPSRSAIEAQRRITVERYHTFHDLAEEYAAAFAAATSDEERAMLMQRFAARRRAHREEDVAQGKRAAGGGIVMRQIMWARWIEIAVDHELAARDLLRRIREGHTDLLTAELRESFVTVSAAAATVEAVFEDVRYLIPKRFSEGATRQEQVAAALSAAFGLSESDAAALLADLDWLFERRNEALHPYTEPEPAQMHPAGLLTGADAARFNAVESGRAVDIALHVLELGAAPPAPYGRWVERWVWERRAHQEQTVASQAARRIAADAS